MTDLIQDSQLLIAIRRYEIGPEPDDLAAAHEHGDVNKGKHNSRYINHDFPLSPAEKSKLIDRSYTQIPFLR